jgi:hypothetical protein
VTPQQILAIILSIIVLVVVLLLLRSYFLPEKYAVTWLVAAVALLVLSIFPGILNSVAAFFGIAQPINLLFVGGFFVVLLILMQLSLDLARTRDELRRAIQKLALQAEERSTGEQQGGDDRD